MTCKYGELQNVKEMSVKGIILTALYNGTLLEAWGVVQILMFALLSLLFSVLKYLF